MYVVAPCCCTRARRLCVVFFSTSGLAKDDRYPAISSIVFVEALIRGLELDQVSVRIEPVQTTGDDETLCNTDDGVIVRSTKPLQILENRAAQPASNAMGNSPAPSISHTSKSGTARIHESNKSCPAPNFSHVERQ